MFIFSSETISIYFWLLFFFSPLPNPWSWTCLWLFFPLKQINLFMITLSCFSFVPAFPTHLPLNSAHAPPPKGKKSLDSYMWVPTWRDWTRGMEAWDRVKNSCLYTMLIMRETGYEQKTWQWAHPTLPPNRTFSLNSLRKFIHFFIHCWLLLAYW